MRRRKEGGRGNKRERKRERGREGIREEERERLGGRERETLVYLPTKYPTYQPSPHTNILDTPTYT